MVEKGFAHGLRDTEGVNGPSLKDATAAFDEIAAELGVLLGRVRGRFTMSSALS